MIETPVLVAFITLVQAITVAVIGGLFSHFTKKAEQKADENREIDMQYRRVREERDLQREERDTCLYDLVFSLSTGTEVLLHQAHGDNMNGNVEDALQSIKTAKAECNHVFNKNVAKI